MATLTIRDLDDEIRDKLRVRAAEQGRSMEAEVRAILAAAVAQPESQADYAWAERIHARFAALGGVDLELEPRTDQPREVTFDG